MSEKTLYIAYGSNINLEQMEYRCPTAMPYAKGYLHSYELEFRGVATIVPKENSKVPVLMWELEPSDEKSLDRYEGFPRMYRKEYFLLEHNGSKRTAMAYVMNSGEIHPPSPTYYRGIEKGYLSVGLDTSYLKAAFDRAVSLSHNENPQQSFLSMKGDW